MAYSASFQWSNAADQTFDVTATDADSGDDIDFSAASAISFVIGDSYACPVFTASLANGKITLPTANVIEVAILESDLQAICPRTYKVGMTYKINNERHQLIYGTVSLYDGLARI